MAFLLRSTTVAASQAFTFRAGYLKAVSVGGVVAFRPKKSSVLNTVQTPLDRNHMLGLLLVRLAFRPRIVFDMVRKVLSVEIHGASFHRPVNLRSECGLEFWKQFFFETFRAHCIARNMHRVFLLLEQADRALERPRSILRAYRTLKLCVEIVLFVL